jgi:hypothetical protein
MKKRNIQILFIVSLAFNLAFIGFGTYRVIQVRKFADPERFIRNIPQEFKDRFHQHREEVKPIRDEIDQIHGEFMTELRRSDYNEDYLKEKLDLFLTRQAALERIMGDNLIKLRRDLTPEQAEKFFSCIPGGKHNGPVKRQFPPHLRKKSE